MEGLSQNDIKGEGVMNIFKFASVIGGRSYYLETWEQQLERVAGWDREEEPPPKTFSKKCPNVPTRTSYKEEGMAVDKEFWEKWTKNPLTNTKPGPRVNPEVVWEIAQEVEYPWKTKVNEIVKTLIKGADLGITGEGRWPSIGKNSPNTEKFGERLVDALQASIILGHMCGPLTEEEVKVLGDIKVAPIDVRPKPNGGVRIIIDLSFPRYNTWKEDGKWRTVQVGDGKVLSPNAGMELWKEIEECSMSTDKDFRQALYICGRNAKMSKNDWAHAYKHVPVRREDWGMQVLKYGGKYFVEKALTFGGKNSPSIFRLIASFVKECVEIETRMDPQLNTIVLDDNCSVGREGDDTLYRYFYKYRDWAERLGIELAGLDDPAKAFAPCTQGEILGLYYDTVRWVWYMPDEKGKRLLALLWEVMEMRGATLADMMTLLGKLNHYMPLVHGRHERGFLYAAIQGIEDMKSWVKLDELALMQLWWWVANLRVVQLRGASIADPLEHNAAGALVLHSDAAGGGSDKWKGWGCYCPENGEVVRGKWPSYILKDSLYKKEKWGSKLTLLEGFAAMMALVTWMPEVKKRGAVELRVDNIGFCYAWKKGHSRDLYIYTLTKAMRDIARMTEIQIEVTHVLRRSVVGDEIVDSLSKNELGKEEMQDRGLIERPPGSHMLLNWIRQPSVLWALGRGLVKEQNSSQLLPGRDYSNDMRSLRAKLGWSRRKRAER